MKRLIDYYILQEYFIIKLVLYIQTVTADWNISISHWGNLMRDSINFFSTEEIDLKSFQRKSLVEKFYRTFHSGAVCVCV